jgi:hypothetical protein
VPTPNPSCACIYNHTAAGPRGIHIAGKNCLVHGDNSAEAPNENH